MLIRVLALLLIVLGPLGPTSLKAFVDLAFLAQMEVVEANLRAQGVTAATATPAQWQRAFTVAEAALGQQGVFRLRFYLAFNLVTPSQIRSFVNAISQLRDNEMRVLGKTDFRGPRSNYASPFTWTGRFDPPTGPAKELKGTTTELSYNFPSSSTNQFLTGLSLDASLAWGYYEQTGPITSVPFYYDPKTQTATAIPLPLMSGDTGGTVVGGSATGSVLVGEGSRPLNITGRVVYEYQWTRAENGTFTVRNNGGYPGSNITRPAGISADGSTTIGAYQDANFRMRAYRWSQAGGFADLGVLTGQTSSQATAASQDGTRIVGMSGSNAFTWKQGGAMTMLPNLPMLTRAQALCISPDESFIGGVGLDASFRETAQLWAKTGDNSYATYDLGKLLGGYGASVSGWTFNQITAIVKNADLSYNIAGNATLNGVPQGFAVQLTATNGLLPSITTQPRAQAVGIGGTAVFSVTATNASSYQWQRNGVNIPGATNATYTLNNAQSAATGTYTVVVGAGEGAVTSTPASLTVANTVSRLNNLSVRATAGTGANTLIVGLTTAGGTKDVLLRGVGPTLTQFGVVGALADPQLALFNSSSVETARNDDWGGSAALTASFNIAGAFPLALTSKDSAILTTLTPGSYSAQVTGTAGTTGVVLMESYDSDIGSPLARYTNLSARNQVGTGANILIVGFNITGSGRKSLLIRAVGPALTQFGVAGALADPQLVVFNAAGTEVARNDDWINRPPGSLVIGPTFASVGAFPLGADSRDAAEVVTLEPGSYTVQVSGVNNTTGVALVEIYELP